MKYYSQAPTRIGLIGGGTDVNPFAQEHGGKVINIAVSLYHKVILVPREDKHILVENLGEIREFDLDSMLPEYGEDKKFDLVYAIINYFRKQFPSGFNLYDRFDGNHSAGLGSSGSAAVAIIAALNQWLSCNLDNKQIALLAWKMEAEILGWICGKQDQLAAAYGGINLLSIGPGEDVAVEPLTLTSNLLAEMKERMLMCYTGGTRHSSQLQEKLKEGMSEEDKLRSLQQLKESAQKLYELLQDGNWQEIGKVLDKAWEEKKRSNPAATNERINFLYGLAKEKGAWGGKVMGAGGEGHMFFFCPVEKQKDVQRALEAEGVSFVDFEIDFNGVTVKTIENEATYHYIYVREGFTPKVDWAVFLDRDGTINKETHLLHKIEDFEFIPHVAKAIALLNQLGIPVIIYHNASVVARGLCDEARVQAIHDYMMKGLAKQEAYLDAIFYCPHHPTAFNLDYANECSWRKPDSGMIQAAAKMFNLNLSHSYVIGDNARDILMGQKEGCYTVLVKTGHGGKDTLYEAQPNHETEDLFEAVKFILQKESLKEKSDQLGL